MLAGKASKKVRCVCIAHFVWHGNEFCVMERDTKTPHEEERAQNGSKEKLFLMDSHNNLCQKFN